VAKKITGYASTPAGGNASIAYSLILLFIGLLAAGFLLVIMEQILGINIHYVLVKQGLSAQGTQTLGILDDILYFLPVIVTIAAISGFIILAYRARYLV
jgi:hypothetical protein